MPLTEGDRIKVTITDLLKAYPDGLTIAEIMKKTGLARHTVLARLHKLEGEGNVGVRQINMAKLHKWEGAKPEEEQVEQGGRAKLTEIKKENIKKKPLSEKPIEKPRGPIDIAQIKKEIEGEMKSGKISKLEAQIKQQREPLKQSVGEKDLKKKTKGVKDYIKSGISGFDELLDVGIPKGNSIIVAGGAGSGKTIFCVQTLINKAKEGKKCLVMTLEEREDKLIQHMEDFGWPANDLIKKGFLKIQRINPFDITRNVDALLAKQKGELLIDIDPVILPKDFAKPDFIVIDSLTAISSAFTTKDESYRIYIEQLFRFLEKTGATSFLITETEQVPKVFSPTGVEEFLADGVIVIYAIKHGNVRESAIELLKLRGAAHQKKIVAMQITGKGMIVYPEQEVFSEME